MLPWQQQHDRCQLFFYFSRSPPLPSQVVRFALASSSLAIPFVRAFNDARKEGCEQSIMLVLEIAFSNRTILLPF